MAAYVIAESEIIDLEGMREYLNRVGTTVEHYGGKYLVRGGIAKTLEGDWHPHPLVILEFENVEQVTRWYHSVEYTAIKAMRHQAARTQLILVPGV